MTKYFFLFFLALIFSSCVSQDQYDKELKEKEALEQELQELKFGAPSMLADGKKFFEAKDFTSAKEKLTALIEKHPDLPESAEAKSILEQINEEELWSTALNSQEVNITQNYINQYPSGKYTSLAVARMDELKILKEKSDYENALNSNSSSLWKSFIVNYPNRDDIDEIKQKIIKCEVDEIMGDGNTGILPSSQQTSSYSSSSSIATISNDTQCELTVRYSGNDIKMITIPAGGTSSIYLSSGNYRIAASACGANYAGTEYLSGNYNSRYYIRTTRY